MDGQGEAGIGPGWAVALETSAFGRFAREDPLLYPLASVLHVLGVGLLVGAILAFDLRVLGLRPGHPSRRCGRAPAAARSPGLSSARWSPVRCCWRRMRRRWPRTRRPGPRPG
ncbi:MAG: hypothetical protein RML45_02680 [Acetobacteraceae bacterium]|nr:hypothetical protein [Acetobacteraceae bacterium]